MTQPRSIMMIIGGAAGVAFSLAATFLVATQEPVHLHYRLACDEQMNCDMIPFVATVTHIHMNR